MENENKGSLIPENEVLDIAEELAAEAAVQPEAEVQPEAAPEMTARQRKKAAKKEKKQQKKAAKKEKRAERKRLRKEVKARRRAEYKAKSFLGKVFYQLGKFFRLVFILLLIVTVVRVNYVELSKPIIALLAASVSGGDPASVTDEQLAEIMNHDDRGAAIDAMEPIGEDETWAFYIYMVGSDLEADSTAQMSEAALLLGELEGNPIKEERTQANRTRFMALMDNLRENDMDLPNVFYEKGVADLAFLNTALENILSGRSDSHLASGDIDSILGVPLPENVKFVIQPGGAGNWTHDMINPNRTQRFVYDSEGVREDYNGSLRNMGDPETLADFLNFCIDEHPADNTMVILWNHGGGPFGFGYDALFKDDHLSIADLREGFSMAVRPNESNPPFDIIGFDACLMANMEAANELSGFADYLVACEDTEPGEGWDYAAWIGALAENPRMNPLQVCKAITDSYVEFYARTEIAQKVGTAALFSIIDLSLADDLYDTYADFATTALKDSVEYAGTSAILGRSANSSIKFAGGDNSYNLVDLGLYMEAALPYYEEEAQEVIDVLNSAVLYHRANSLARESTGMTVYYPATTRDVTSLGMTLQYVDEISRSEEISILYYYKVAGCLTEEMKLYMEENGYGELKPMDVKPLKQLMQNELVIGEDGNITVKGSAEAYTITQSVDLNLLQVTDDETARALGQDKYAHINDENDVRSSFKGEWVFIEGQPLAVSVVSNTTNTVRYSADIRYNDSPAKMLLAYDFESDKWSVLGVQETETENSLMADRNTISLQRGDVIEPVYTDYNIEDGSSSTSTGDKITYRDGLDIADGILPDGEYMYYVSLTDARGEIYSLPVVALELNDGLVSGAHEKELSWTKAA